MKNILVLSAAVLVLASCSPFQRLGDFTVISNKNFETQRKYDLIASNVEIKVKNKGGDILEKAVDELTEKHNGEYLMNVQLYMRKNGKKFKIKADVYGNVEVSKSISTEVQKNIVLRIGDSVVFKNMGKLTKAKIIGVNNDSAIVEFEKGGSKKQKSLKFEDITKVEE